MHLVTSSFYPAQTQKHAKTCLNGIDMSIYMEASVLTIQQNASHVKRSQRQGGRAF